MSHRPSITTVDKFYLPIQPLKPFSMIAIADVANAVVEILSQPGYHVMKTYTIAAPPHTAEEAAQKFSEVLGRVVQVEQVSYDQYRSSQLSMGYLEWAVDGLMEYFRLIDADSQCSLVRHSDYEVSESVRHLAGWATQGGIA